MIVNIGITTKNRREFLQNCLESIEKNTIVDYNLFIADDASNKNTIKYLTTTPIKNLREVLLCKEPSGITHSINSIWKYSEFYNWFNDHRASEYFCYLQDDTIIEQEGWLKILIEVYEAIGKEHRIGFFGGFSPPEHKTNNMITYKEWPIELKASSRATNLIATYDHWNKCTMPHRIDCADNKPRGFPTASPKRGSNYDVFLSGGNSRGIVGQPTASKTSNAHQGKVYMCIPGFVKHTANDKKDSTWNNKNKENNDKEK